MTNADKPRHILVMNDSEEVLSLMQELLEEEGYRVTVQRYAAKEIADILGVAPDLVILNYMWASADTGWSMLQTRKMSRETRDLPIVICTGAVTQVKELEAHLVEMSVRVVLKPFDIEELLSEIGTALGE